MLDKHNSKKVSKPSKAHILMPSSKELHKIKAKLEPKQLSSEVAFKPLKSRLPIIKLVRCKNSACPYYKKRHRRYVWPSQTESDKPSCPKCFSHNTEIIATHQF